ncbi:MAG: mechanosensitive ion channel [Chloroflexi bacterium]|nr:mechanosensitive ion channel [Chloroflexota bacterium]
MRLGTRPQKYKAIRNPVWWILIAVLVFVIALLIVPLFRPSLGVYVTVVVVGFAVVLQKYVASFAGYFVLRTSKLFEVGHRIRLGTIKGDVRQIGLLHFALDEVGEGEHSGGELTGRVIHIPNHVILDQPVLNFSQDFSSQGELFRCEYLFDEVRLPMPDGIPLVKARGLLGQILREEDTIYIEKAREFFGPDRPNFLEEAAHSPRVMVFVDDKKAWLVGRFVAPVRGRNELRSIITTRFLEAAEKEKNAIPVEIKL